MSWECPKCGKIFARDNQGHHCVRVSQDEFLEQFSPKVAEVYLLLLENAQTQFEIRESFTLKAISWYAPSNKVFLVMHPKKKWLDSFYYLDSDLADFPVYKTQASQSGKRFAHYMRFHEAEDVDQSAMNRLAEAYRFAMN